MVFSSSFGQNSSIAANMDDDIWPLRGQLSASQPLKLVESVGLKKPGAHMVCPRCGLHKIEDKLDNVLAEGGQSGAVPLETIIHTPNGEDGNAITSLCDEAVEVIEAIEAAEK